MILERLKEKLADLQIIIYRHGSPERSRRMRLINQVKQERELLLSHVEAEQLINALEASARIPGDVAEVGVYQGASARILRHYADPIKTVHLFDTFCGLPQPGESDADFVKGQFKSSLKQVQDYLGFSGIQYHVGIFPQSITDGIAATKFSFVHLDVDLYEGTLDCLRFFYPRMNLGGIILCHDVGAERAPGVLKAINEYFQPLEVPWIQLSGYQGLVIKVETQQEWNTHQDSPAFASFRHVD
jgi:O-methyltransferase